MHKSRLRFYSRHFWIPLLILQLIFPLQLRAQVANQLSLPAEDIIAPKVVHQIQNRGINPNGTYFFSADVTDDVAVQSVTLFYRTKGEQQYIAIPMTSSKPPTYTALLSPQSVKAPGLEYYIQAKDSSGNAVLVGAAFSPLSMAVAVPVSADGKTLATKGASSPDTGSASDSDSGKEHKSSNAKWWWIAAGVVVVALVAGGGGGGGGDSAPPPATTTGGITISAPLPQ